MNDNINDTILMTLVQPLTTESDYPVLPDNYANRYLAYTTADMLVYKGHVTAGVTSEVVETLEVTKQNPFNIVPMMKEDVIWVKPNRVCIVEYMPNLNQTLRQPVFKGLRDDVVAEDVQL